MRRLCRNLMKHNHQSFIMRVVFDIDDTISRHKNRDYPNAEPILEVITQMRKLRETNKDAVIILHTARGMNSCGGDVRKAEEKNRKTLEEWLKKWDVPYDEIIFGKPIADVYVDDKSIRPDVFAHFGLGSFSGFSGNKINFIGDVIVKDCDNAKEQYEWYMNDKKLCPLNHKTPEIYSVTLGKVYMQYVPFRTLWHVIADTKTSPVEKVATLGRVIAILQEFKQQILSGENDIMEYIHTITHKAEPIGVDVTEIMYSLHNCSLLNEVTQCHGDMTFSNILNTETPTLIDPSHTYGLCSWLVDAGKVRASLNGLNAIIEGSDIDLSYLVPVFDAHFNSEEREVIKLLEKTHFVRVAYSAHKQGKIKEVELLKKML